MDDLVIGGNRFRFKRVPLRQVVSDDAGVASFDVVTVRADDGALEVRVTAAPTPEAEYAALAAAMVDIIRVYAPAPMAVIPLVA